MLVAMNEWTFENKSSASYTVSSFTRWADVVTELYQLDSSARAYRVQVHRKRGLWYVVIGFLFDQR